jgi:hypothetical protein
MIHLFSLVSNFFGSSGMRTAHAHHALITHLLIANRRDLAQRRAFWVLINIPRPLRESSSKNQKFSAGTGISNQNVFSSISALEQHFNTFDSSKRAFQWYKCIHKF